MSNVNGAHDYAQRMEVWKQTVARKTSLFATHTAAIVDFASLAIKSIILGNGAAAGAVLAFLASLWGHEAAATVSGPALKSVTIFAAGAFAAMIAAAGSYFAQYCYAQAEISEDHSKRMAVFNRVGIAFHLAAIVAAFTGIGSFAWGAWEGIASLAAANGGFAPPS